VTKDKPDCTKRLTLYLTDAEWESLMIVAGHEKQTMHDWTKHSVLVIVEIAAVDANLVIPMPRRS
jgi:hypothetical protein